MVEFCLLKHKEPLPTLHVRSQHHPLFSNDFSAISNNHSWFGTKREHEKRKGLKNTSNAVTRTAPPTGQCSVFSAILRNYTSAFSVPTSRMYLRERVRPHGPSGPYPYYWRRRNIFVVTTDNNTLMFFWPCIMNSLYINYQLDALTIIYS